MSQKITLFLFFYTLTGVTIWFILKRVSKRVKYFEDIEQFFLMGGSYFMPPVTLALIVFWPIILIGILWIRPLFTDTRSPEEPSGKSHQKWIGMKAVCLTDLRPIGKIDISGNTFEAKSTQDYLSKDTVVTIIGFQGSNFIVEQNGSYL